jgi:hypothetical protein
MRSWASQAEGLDAAGRRVERLIIQADDHDEQELLSKLNGFLFPNSEQAYSNRKALMEFLKSHGG